MQYLTRQLTDRRLPLALERLLGLRNEHGWILILLCADLAVLGDVISGPRVWFGPVYLLVICLAAWRFGWRAGQITGLGCMALTLSVNGATLYPFETSDLVWNFAARFAAVSVIIAVIAGARGAYVREWRLARTDALTGALNRKAFFELGGDLAQSSNWRLLIYADLDGLKQINDRDGHAAGDRALSAYANAVRRAIRANDMFARVGGDEFIVFLDVRDELSARAVALRLHERMNDVPSAFGANLKCSAGGLIIPPGSMPIDELVRLADELMYQAKLRGACLQVGGPAVTGERAPIESGTISARRTIWASASATKRQGERRGDRAAEAPERVLAI